MRGLSVWQDWVLRLLTIALALVVAAPIMLIVLNSFQTTQQILKSQTFVPQDLTLSNYSELLLNTPFLRYLSNSVVVAVGSTIATLVVASLAGYALSRFRSAPMRAYSQLLLMVQMFPIIMALIPLFIVFRNLGLLNHPAGPIVIYTLVHLPFATWMFRAFFDTVPRELEEAALVDGSSRFGAFIRIVLPLAGPGMVSVAIFSTLFAYNEFFIASVLLRDDDVMTAPVGVQRFMQQFQTDWGMLLAAATVTMVPVFLIFMFLQKYMTYGGIAGGVKG